MFANIDEALKYIRDEKIEQIDVKVTDLVGRWRRMTYSAAHVTERLFTHGTGISLSPYPGFRAVESGDMTVVPDVTSAFLDPFHERPTLSMICDIRMNDGTGYVRDPRAAARRAEACLDALGLGGHAVFSPELEFYIFDEADFGSGPDHAFWQVGSRAVGWGPAGDTPVYRTRMSRSGQMDQPVDRYADLRSEMVARIERAGIPVKYHHHELGSPGQTEIEVFFDTPVRSADALMIMRYIVKNTALEHGKLATFMPKPLHGEAGNGMHFHQYITDGKRSLFYDPEGYSGLNRHALQYLAGLLHHTPALMGLGNASTNSFRRFSPNLAAPVKLFFATSNRSSALRIPGYAINEREARIEYRMPDGTANPYLIVAAQLMAGLDGIAEKMDPTEMGFGPFEINVFALPQEEQDKLRGIPTDFDDALGHLDRDRGFLKRGDVFDDDLIDAWIDFKRQDEIHNVHERPHPYEYELYFDL